MNIQKTHKVLKFVTVEAIEVAGLKEVKTHDSAARANNKSAFDNYRLGSNVQFSLCPVGVLVEIEYKDGNKESKVIPFGNIKELTLSQEEV